MRFTKNGAFSFIPNVSFKIIECIHTLVPLILGEIRFKAEEEKLRGAEFLLFLSSRKGLPCAAFPVCFSSNDFSV